MISGLDVSHWNVVDWPDWANRGYKFSWIKATEGTDWHDSQYFTHKANSEGQGFITGPYHYFRAGFDGAQQAKFFNTYVGMGGKLPPAVDVESINNTGFAQSFFANRLKACLLECENLFGRRPMIYTSKSKWEQLVGNVSWAADYDLWVAHYSTALTAPLLPNGWVKWAVWQYTSTPLDQERMQDEFYNKIMGESVDEVVLRLSRKTTEELHQAIHKVV